MNCPKCGKENPDNDKICSSCGLELDKVPEVSGKLIPKMSSLAIAAFLLGIISFFTFGLTIIPAIILGIISIIIIEQSGGKITGRGFAIMGIVIAMLVFLINFVPLFLKVRRTAFAVMCGTNLEVIGRAMQIYANDYDDKYPHAGGIDSIWSNNIQNWKASNRYGAYGLKVDDTGGQATISSCFYLLVKYAGVSPKSFICQGDKGAIEFIPSDEGAGNMELVDLWDFGPESSKHCSYSYHMPFSQYALTKSSKPGMAVAADRNPWIDSPKAKAKKWSVVSGFDVKKKDASLFNAITHKGDVQNVLFVDGHVGSMRKPFCGVNDDNIFTFWNGGDVRIGDPPVIGSEPQGKLDSLLVHDPP